MIMAHKARLRKVGGSVMLAIPPALLDALDLSPEQAVGLTIKAGRLVVEPEPRRRYSLDDLIAQCDPKARHSPDDREWVSGGRAGRELL
jgi:antitoxin ChpS